MMVRCAFDKAVVGRVANFPFAPWGRGVEKRVVDGKNPCNITWGYVAWMG
jgi:hypothetical protein